MSDTVIIPVHQWTNDGDEVLVVRFASKDGKSYNNFQHPMAVGETVTAPDWVANCNYGSGIADHPRRQECHRVRVRQRLQQGFGNQSRKRCEDYPMTHRASETATEREVSRTIDLLAAYITLVIVLSIAAVWIHFLKGK